MSESPIITLNGANHSHTDSAVELLGEFWLFTQSARLPQAHAHAHQPGAEFFLDQLNLFLLPHRRFALAQSEGESVGCVALSELNQDSYSNACELHCLYVKPNSRGQGFGHQLIEQALLWAQELKHSHLIFNPLGESESLRSIYSKFGFEEIPPLTHTPSSHNHLLMLELR